ncbi:MAG TPA: hypothetical protein VFV49_07635 [Thermoanaerobaculia bacterium]|nr:hypothetical protein [Thermoanaerobaculia bacterium]
MSLIVLGIGMVALTGCVSTKIVPIQQDRIANLNGRTITVTTREKPSFGAMTAGKATFGLLGAAAMISAGNKLVEKNAIEDPAGYIASELAGSFASANAMTVVPTEGVLAKSTNPGELARQYAGADILLDVQTVNWSFAYFPTDWNSYRVIYSAKARLIDTKTRKILAEGFCARVPDKTEDAPGYDELLDNQAARLKQELKTAADHCISEFRAKVLTSSGRPNAVTAQ